MSDHQCTACLHRFSSGEYRALVSRAADPDNPRYGRETVCTECGEATTSNQWSHVEAVETTDGEIEVSTAALLIPHGLNENQWFETCLFHPYGSIVSDRYETKDEAEEGHEKRVEQIREGAYSWVSTGKQIDLEANHA